jgi:cytochrome c biogenesis protein CcdA
MNAIDIVFGLLAGVVSCLTPEALLLLPLMVAAAGAVARPAVVAPAIGLGVAVILTGALAASFGAVSGLGAEWFRRIVCVLLIVQAILLMRASTMERFSFLTGGDATGSAASGAVRRFLLALLVGANWNPVPGPTLGKASLMAADAQNDVLAFGILFVFGAGAAVPWIVLGRAIRLVARGVAPRVLDGLAGKRILGLTLLAVAIVGVGGLDVTASRQLDRVLPPWMHKLAVTF